MDMLTPEGLQRVQQHLETLKRQQERMRQRVLEDPVRNPEAFAALAIEVARREAAINCLNELLSGVL